MDATFRRHDGGGDHVHIRVHLFHDPGNRGAVQRRQVHFSNRPVVENVDRLNRLVRHLADETAQVTGQRNPRAHDLSFLGSHGRHVQSVFNRPVQQVVRHLLRHLQGDVFLRLGRGSAQMRGANHVGQVEERVFLGGFFGEHVKSRTRDMAGFQHVGQRIFVDQTAAGTVDDAYTCLGLFQVLTRQDVAGLVGQWHVQGDEISSLQQVFEFDLFDLHGLGLVFAQERIVGDDLHLQSTGALAYDATDVARADHAQRFTGQLDAHELGFLPLAGMGRAGGLWDLTRDGKHHCNRMFSGGDHVAERRIHHNHAFLRRCILVDVVGADPGAADDLEIVGMFQNCRRDLGG